MNYGSSDGKKSQICFCYMFLFQKTQVEASTILWQLLSLMTTQ